ncbi:MAG: ABC transporter ATP-binding protein [Pseudomonadota bacterium]
MTTLAPDATAFEAVDIAKSFGGLKAVDGVTLAVARQEVLGIIGPNGAGKTTLFNLLAGALMPDRGTIKLSGEDVTEAPAETRANKGLARTFQIPRPFAEMTVRDNLLVAGQDQRGETMVGSLFSFLTVARQERALKERADRLAEFLRLTPVLHDLSKSLSGGQRKLLELGRALMAEPQLLLLDEPAAGVNPALMEFIMERVEEINAGGVTVVLIEHNMSVVERLCGRAVVMASGRLLAEGPPGEVLADPDVVEAYLGSGPAAA